MKIKREKGRKTANRILEHASELFAEGTFRGVTVRMIAEKSGIRESSLYNHFESKADILDTLYENYMACRLGIWKNEDEIEGMINFMGPPEILKTLFFSIQQRMNGTFLNTVRIILAERYTDPKAASLYYQTMVAEPVEFYEKLLNKLIKKKLIKPIDSRQFAVEFNLASMSATMEYFMSLNGMEEKEAAVKKMARHIEFFSGLLQTG
ncbi:MAG: TetR/AcrR family transcriptional regulator [Spirochaetia bacterium]